MCTVSRASCASTAPRRCRSRRSTTSIRARTRSTSGSWPSWTGTWSPSTLHSKAVADPTLKEARMQNANDPTVHVRRDKRPQGVIAYLTIDDCGGLNVMSSAVMDALAEALLALASDEDLRAVVL